MWEVEGSKVHKLSLAVRAICVFNAVCTLITQSQTHRAVGIRVSLLAVAGPISTIQHPWLDTITLGSFQLVIWSGGIFGLYPL